jgi:hypothetical protein
VLVADAERQSDLQSRQELRSCLTRTIRSRRRAGRTRGAQRQGRPVCRAPISTTEPSRRASAATSTGSVRCPSAMRPSSVTDQKWTRTRANSAVGVPP